jgi:hypothetical protein
MLQTYRCSISLSTRILVATPTWSHQVKEICPTLLDILMFLMDVMAVFRLASLQAIYMLELNLQMNVGAVIAMAMGA